MAELILTEEEKHSANYMQWDDAALGKAVKKVSLNIRDIQGDDALMVTSCATVLASRAARKKAKAIVVPLVGLTDGSEHLGDWEIVIRRMPRLGDEDRR